MHNEQRRAVCDWLRANGIDPNRVSADSHASMTDGQLTLLRKLRDENGRDVLNPERTAVMTETITVPVTTPPPPAVKRWLESGR